jgi:hypothetical protein
MNDAGRDFDVEVFSAMAEEDDCKCKDVHVMW